ncbi:hypothetical protein V6Z12_A13G156300 [Gossypium hirsutum]
MVYDIIRKCLEFNVLFWNLFMSIHFSSQTYSRQLKDTVGPPLKECIIQENKEHEYLYSHRCVYPLCKADTGLEHQLYLYNQRKLLTVISQVTLKKVPKVGVQMYHKAGNEHDNFSCHNNFF